MSAYTEMSREQLISVIEKMTLASALLRVELVNAIDLIAEGEDVSEDDLDKMAGTIERADELSPLENIESLIETPTSVETAELARLMGGYTKEGGIYIPGHLH